MDTEETQKPVDPAQEKGIMVVTDGVLKVADLPRVYAEFRKPIDNEGLQKSDGAKTGKGYDTLGYGYAWVTERLNDVVGPQCWRAVIQKEDADIVKIGTRDGYQIDNEIVLQLGNWREFDELETTGDSGTGFKRTVSGKKRDFHVIAESFGFGGHRAFGKADARKGAFTNGLKKAAGIMGIGNDAYKKSIDEENEDISNALDAKRLKKGTTTVPKDDAVTKIKNILLKRGATDDSSALALFERQTGLKWTTFQGVTQVMAQRGLAALMQAVNNQK